MCTPTTLKQVIWMVARIKAQIAKIKNMRAYKLMLSIYFWSSGLYVIASKAANIFDKKILKIGKITPDPNAAMIPTMKIGILSVE